MNLCGVVILFNPDDQVARRITSYQNVLDFLILIDNSVQSNCHLIKGLLSTEKAVYLQNGSNEGIAKRLNQAAAIARDQGCTWLLTMDQDSSFDTATLKQYLTCVTAYPSIEQVSMFGLEHDQRLLVTNASCLLQKTTLLITSGSLVNLSIHKAIGGFDEELFIDQVDHEYCFRSLIANYEIVKVRSLLMQHAIGNASQHRSFKSLKQTKRSLHSPLRLYYMVRNYFYVKEKYNNQFEKEIGDFRHDLSIRIKNNLLYNKEKLQTLQSIFKGYRDYKRGKMGKYKKGL